MSTRKYSDKQEKDIAKLVGGKVQSNSGGTQFGGGDVLTEAFLVEAKTPTSSRKSYSIKEEWLDKAQEQAFEQGKPYSTLAFRFNPEGPDYFVISERLFKYLVSKIEEEINNG